MIHIIMQVRTTVGSDQVLTSVDLTDYNGRQLVLENSLQLSEIEYGDNFKSALSTARFRMRFAGPLAPALLDDTTRIQIIDDDSHIFSGYIRPVAELRFRGLGHGDSIAVEVLDTLSVLKGTHTGPAVDLTRDGPLKICDPENPDASAVHILAALMGWDTEGWGYSVPAIDQAIPLVRVYPNDDLRAILDAVVFCSGHYLKSTAAGALSLRPFVLESPTPEMTFSGSSGTITRDLSIAPRDPDQTGVACGYRQRRFSKGFTLEAESIDQVIVNEYADGTWRGKPFDRKPLVWPHEIGIDGTPPVLSLSQLTSNPDAWDDRYSRFRKTFTVSGSPTTIIDDYIPFPAPSLRGLSHTLWKIVDPTILLRFIYGSWGIPEYPESIEARIDKTGTISWWNATRGAPLSQYAARIPIAAEWDDFGVHLRVGPFPGPYVGGPYGARVILVGRETSGTLEYFFNSMDAPDRTDQPSAFSGAEGKVKSLVLEYVVDHAVAAGIAQALYAHLRASEAVFRSVSRVEPGSIVRVVHADRSIDLVGRITRRTATIASTTLYDYVVESLAPITVESSYLPPAIPDPRAAGQSSAAGAARALDVIASLATRPTHEDVQVAISDRARVFFSQPVGPYAQGDLWVDEGALFQSQVDRGEGEYVDDDWVWCLRTNVSLFVESSNGTVFKPGQSTTTLLIARVFRNGLEITSELPASRFRWRRSSYYPQSPPYDDSTWNSNHASGYKTVEVVADDIYAHATYFCDLLD